MKFWHFLVIVLVAIIQTTVMHYFSIKLGMVNLLLVILIIMLFLRHFESALIWAAFGGLILDLLSSTPVGVYFFGFIIIYFGLAAFFKTFEFEEFIVLLIIMIVVSVFFDLFSWAYIGLWGVRLPIRDFSNIIIFDTLLNTISICILYPILISINKFFSAKKQKVINISEFYK